MSRPSAAPGEDRWIMEEWRLIRAARLALARAGRRPRLVLVLPLLLAGATVGIRAQQSERFEAILYLRLAEGDLPDSTLTPRPPRDIREYISNVALSRHQLKQVMENRGWSSAWMVRDPVAAVDDFKEDIAIEVSRNYFLYGRARQGEPRTAQVIVSMLGNDAEKTRAIAHDIGQTIVRHQEVSRRSRLTEARNLLASTLAEARERSGVTRQSLQRLSTEVLAAGGRATDESGRRLEALEAEARSAIDRGLELERRLASVEFSSAAEGEQLGLNLQLVDERLVALSPPLTRAALALLGAVAYLVALLLVAPLVGAFDDRLYGVEDLAEQRLELVGAFPRFPGDEAGARRSRGGNCLPSGERA